MKPELEEYNKIPSVENLKNINIPGCYCAGCGEIYALYYYSICKPNKRDENDKLYYESCDKCPIDEKYLKQQFSYDDLNKLNPELGNKLTNMLCDMAKLIKQSGVKDYDLKNWVMKDAWGILYETKKALEKGVTK